MSSKELFFDQKKKPAPRPGARSRSGAGGVTKEDMLKLLKDKGFIPATKDDQGGVTEVTGPTKRKGKRKIHGKIQPEEGQE